MKGGRSNRVAASAEQPPDDWVNGSWTVDCICGVTFDDGEEMVNCDECGVWVHTRCSRFVKGEKSFACDKCKTKRRRRTTSASAATDDEETEVAQLLAELPTKTIHHHKIKMSSNNVSGTTTAAPATAASGHCLRPYRLWTERPLEERVHVQGVPGGDPDLFNDNASGSAFPVLISSQLWKCSGYIPKHFNFLYSEFPCWESTTDASQVPGVLLSLSKPTSLAADKKRPPPPPPPPPLPKERNLADKKRSTLFHLSSKRSRVDSEHRTAKKKQKSLHREHQQHESKRDKLPASKTVPSTATTPGAPVVESKVHKVAANTHLASVSSLEKPKRNAVTNDGKLAPRSSGESSMAASNDKTVNADKPAFDGTTQLHKSAKTTLNSLPSSDKDVALGALIKKEGQVDEIQAGHSESPTNMPLSKPLNEDLTNAASERKKTEICRSVEAIIPLATGNCGNKMKQDVRLDNPKGVLVSHPADIDIKSDAVKKMTDHVLSPDREFKGSKSSENVANTSELPEKDGKDSDKGSEAVGICQFDKKDEVAIQCSTKLECEGSENSMEVHKRPSDAKEVAKVAGQMPQGSGAVPPPPPSHPKTVSVGKPSSTSPAVVFSRSYLSDKSRNGGSQNPVLVSKRMVPNSSGSIKKDNEFVDSAKNEDKLPSTLKDNLKPCFNSTSKASQLNKTVLKHYVSVGKDSLRQSTLKVSSVGNSSVSSSVSEPAGMLQSEQAVRGQQKSTASAVQQRAEKVPQSSVQPSHKSTQSSIGHATVSSNSPAGLSDEELALLLHQELNSSPRVPRVPRVRNAGSLPQLSTAAAANMLIKRTSTSGGKDQNTFSRRKSRDSLKDGSRNSREQDSEARKVDRVPSSPDSIKKSDTFTRVDMSNDSSHKAKKNREKISSSAKKCSSLSANAGLKSSSTRVNSSEDEAGANKNSTPTYRTLPGLIAEIMGAGRRMTYVELCNAVLPHWPNLRKHNGERYAYSSHSQAVLDCLRNRTEWAQLVDRGPKTSSGRKKRKIDAEPLNSESEDGESKSFESNKEEFPKGRRQARKGRRLAPQGRSFKDTHKRRKVELGSSSDSGSSSSSSEESVSSQDDSQGSGMDVAKSDVSASSREVRGRS